MKNIPSLLALHSIDGLGPIRLKAILDYFKDPKLAWEADSREMRKIGMPQGVVDLLIKTRKELEPESYAEKINQLGIKWMTLFDENYPNLLKEIYDPPIVLYYQGEILPPDNQAIAVVGTRKITGYGRAVTRQFTNALVGAGLTIVSGLARGIDSQAHLTTLESGGRTIAVLGSGLNRIYPSENKDLAQRIINAHGAVISEFPPDIPSFPGNFPARNRIISGLSLGVLVAEAAEDSGSLITARLALEQGREVFAIPGPIFSTLSKGPIDLIKEGARAVFDPQEILDELGIRRIKNQELRIKDVKELSAEEKKVLECLENETRHIDEIGRILNFPAAKISAVLLKMEISGLIQSLGSGNYSKS